MFALYLNLADPPAFKAFAGLIDSEGRGIAVYNTRADAIADAVQRLVDVGELRQESDGYYAHDKQPAGTDEATALNWWVNLGNGARDAVVVIEVTDRRSLQVIDDPLLVIRHAVVEAMNECEISRVSLGRLNAANELPGRVIDNLPDVFRQPLQGGASCE